MKHLVQRMLLMLARRIVMKYRPHVIAVTGSVGKTSTKMAIATILEESFKLRVSAENYNNEFGVPLTIIGRMSPGRSLLGWMAVVAKALWLLVNVDTAYPRVLVLEYGIDHPGDMEVLCRVAPPDIAVLTRISPVHVEFFGSLEALAAEKSSIFDHVKPGGVCVLNVDDPRVASNKTSVKHPVTYGFTPGADVTVENVHSNTEFDDVQLAFTLVHHKNRVDARMPGHIAKTQISSVLAATAAALHMDMELSVIAERLASIPPTNGRMRPLPGIKGTMLLDDSYNAAPASMHAALDVLMDFSPVEEARRIAVLGKMAELGNLTEQEHRLLGMRVAELGIDVLITVTEPAADIRRAAIEAGLDESQTHQFGTSKEAGRWLDQHVRGGDVVLVKGSQSARMEHVVKDLMAEPERSDELLVRQTRNWLS